jgi:hypothetical protein
MDSRHPETHVNYLPLILTSTFSITLNANGLSLVTGLPFLATMAIAAFLYAVKMRLFLGNDYGDDDARYNSRSLLGYAALAVLFLGVGAFGIFGYSGRSSAEMLAGQTAPLFDERRGDPWRGEVQPRPADFIRDVDPPTAPGEWIRPAPVPTTVPASVVEALKIGSFLGFVQSTFAKHTFAIICWIVALVLEVFILLLLRQVQFEQDYGD